jgi:DNA-binding XRE family transcriptional regulator
MQVAPRKRIPNLLRKYRRAKGLKQSDVAKVLGLKNTSRISCWEKGIYTPNLTNALQLSLLYQVMVEGLFVDQVHSLKQGIQRKQFQILGHSGTMGVAGECAPKIP